MKTLALAFCALLLVAGVAPMALAQDTTTQSPAPSAAPTLTPPPDSKAPEAKAPDAKAPDAKAPDTRVDVNVKSDKSDDAAASPRTGEMHRTGFFGLSPTAAIIVSVAVLLVVILAIVAMTHSGGGTTYIDNHDRRV